MYNSRESMYLTASAGLDAFPFRVQSSIRVLVFFTFICRWAALIALKTKICLSLSNCIVSALNGGIALLSCKVHKNHAYYTLSCIVFDCYNYQAVAIYNIDSHACMRQNLHPAEAFHKLIACGHILHCIAC